MVNGRACVEDRVPVYGCVVVQGCYPVVAKMLRRVPVIGALK